MNRKTNCVIAGLPAPHPLHRRPLALRRTLFAILAAAVWIAPGAQPAARSADAFAIIARGNGDLRRLDIQRATHTLLRNNGGQYNGLAFGAGQTVLYGIFSTTGRSPFQLVSIDPATGVNTVVGVVMPDISALASLPDGRLFGVGYDHALYQINPANAATTRMGPTGLPDLSTGIYFENSLASDGASLHYTLGLGSASAQRPVSLYRLDLATGAATLIGPTGTNRIAGSVFAGATFGTGQLYGFRDNGATYAINLATGAATWVAHNGLTDIYGGVGIIHVLPPVVTLADAIRCAGDTVTLAPQVAGAGPFTYQWRRNGVDMPAATTATLGPILAPDNYAVVVCNEGGCATSRVAQVSFSLGPDIVRQPPASIAMCPGTPVAIEVAVSGGPNSVAHVQWTRDGRVLPAPSALTLRFASVQSSDAGIYRALVSDGVCVTASAPCVLTVTGGDLIGAECPRLMLQAPQPLGNGRYRISLSRTNGVPFYTNSPPVLDLRYSRDVSVPWNSWLRVPANELRVEGGKVVWDHAASGSSQFYRAADRSALRFNVPAMTNFGGLGTLPGKFVYPQGMGLGVGGELHVVDDSNQRVQVFDKDTLVFKREYANGLFFPNDVAVDARGFSYVSEYAAESVSVYAPDGSYLRSFPLRSRADPAGLSIDPTSGNLVVAEAPAEDSRISVWTTAGTLVRSWTPPTGTYDVWVSGTGEVFCAAWGGIYRYSNVGVLLGQFAPRHIAGAICGDDSGILYVTYLDHESVDAYSIDGELQCTYEMTACPLETPYSGFTFGVAYGGPNQLFVTDRANHKVIRLEIVRQRCSDCTP